MGHKYVFDRSTVPLWVIAAVAALIIGLFNGLNRINTAETLEISVLTALVLITMWYAKQTKTMAEEMREQAKASMQMVKAVQTPRLLPYLDFIGDFDPARCVKFRAGVYNDGQGPAYDLEFRIEDDGTPPSIVNQGPRVPVLGSHDKANPVWANLRIPFPASNKVQRRFFIIRYKDVAGEYEICQPFVMTTVKKGRPFAMPESVSKRTLEKRSFEEDLP